jgi:PAS domain S-box-containing protein
MRIAQISAVYHSEQDEAASLQHGADIYLRSPIEPEVLPVVVETLARLRRPDLASAPPLSPLGIAHVELAGYLNQANQRFCDITGRSPQQLCRMTVGELFHWDDAALASEMFREMTQGTGGDFRKEMRLLVNGRAVWTDCSFSLVMSASGVVREAVMVIFDVSGERSPAPGAE